MTTLLGNGLHYRYYFFGIKHQNHSGIRVTHWVLLVHFQNHLIFRWLRFNETFETVPGQPKYLDAVLMDPHCIVCGTRMSQYPWHWMICFVPLPCQSGINTTSTHTPPVSRVLPTLFSVFSIAIPLPQSVIFSNYHLPSTKSQGSSLPGFMFLVNHVQGVCSTLCNASVTPGLNIKYSFSQSPDSGSPCTNNHSYQHWH